MIKRRTNKRQERQLRVWGRIDDNPLTYIKVLPIFRNLWKENTLQLRKFLFKRYFSVKEIPGFYDIQVRVNSLSGGGAELVSARTFHGRSGSAENLQSLGGMGADSEEGGLSSWGS